METYALDDFADEYAATVVIPRETARASIDAEYAAAIAAIESARAAKYAAVGIADPRVNRPHVDRAIRSSVKTAGKSRIFDDDATITVVSTNHGLRPGAINLRRFELLKQVGTVRGAHQLGVDNGYLRFYADRGLITIA